MERKGRLPAAAAGVLRGSALRTLVVYLLAAQLHPERVVPCAYQRLAACVSVIGEVPEVRASHGPALGIDASVLPAAGAVVGMPGLHHLHALGRLQVLDDRHLLGQRGGELRPVPGGAALRVQTEHPDPADTEVCREIDDVLDLVQIDLGDNRGLLVL